MKNHNKKIKIKSGVIVCVFLIVLLLTIASLMLFSDYTFKIKFNNEDITFINNETLYFTKRVLINLETSNYKMYVDSKKVANNYEIDTGEHNVVLKKYFKKVKFTIHIFDDDSFYITDEDGNEIHNYLSNNKSFYIKGRALVDMADYDKSLIKEKRNYVITTGSDTYSVNILDY